MIPAESPTVADVAYLMKAERSVAEGMVTRRELNSVRFVLRERERELLEVKGRCSNKRCRLHYAHSGPCDEFRTGL